MEKSKCRLETRVLSGQSDEKVMPDLMLRTKSYFDLSTHFAHIGRFQIRKKSNYCKYCRIAKLIVKYQSDCSELPIFPITFFPKRFLSKKVANSPPLLPACKEHRLTLKPDVLPASIYHQRLMTANL